MNDDLRYEIAQTFLAYGYPDEAVSLLKELSKRYPQEDELKLLLAEAYYEGGKEEEALDLLRQVPTTSGHYLAAILLMADIYLNQGLSEVALDKVRQALESWPEEKLLYQALGEIYFNQGEYSLALLNFVKAGETSPDKLAQCYAHLGRFEEALEQYEQALKQNKNISLLFGAGFVAFQMGEWEKCISFFEEVIDQDPYYVSVYPYLAQAYLKLNRRREALEKVEAGLRYDETNAQLFFLYGLLLKGAKQKAEAKRSFEEAVRLDPEYGEAWEALWSLSQEEDEPEETLHYLGELLELFPDRPDLWLAQGELYDRLEQFTEAEHSFQQAYRLAPQDVEVLNRFASFLHAQGKREEAKKMWTKSLAIQPDQWEIEEMLLRENDA